MKKIALIMVGLLVVFWTLNSKSQAKVDKGVGGYAEKEDLASKAF